MDSAEVLSRISTLLTGDLRNTAAVLEEPSVGMTVPVLKGGVNYLSYTFDKGLDVKRFPRGLFPFFSKDKGNHSMCDYMLFAWTGGRLYVLLVELKQGRSNATQQLKAGRLLARFIVGTLNRVTGWALQPECRMIAVRDKFITHRPTTKHSGVTYDRDGFTTFEGANFIVKDYCV